MRQKIEKAVATNALLGLVLLFGSFLFTGATKALTLWAVALVAAVLLTSHLLANKSISKLIKYGTVAVAVLVVVSSGLLIRTRAALSCNVSDFSVPQFGVTAEASGGNNSSSEVTGKENVITVKAKGYNTTNSCGDTVANTDTITVTVTNTSSAAVTYDLALSNVTGATAGTGLTLDPGKSLTMTVTSGSGAGKDVTGTITFSNVKSVTTGVEETTTFLKPDGGSYTVDDAGITEDSPLTTSSDHEYTLVATPGSDFVFYGWMSKCGGRLSTEASYTYTATEGNNDSVWPLFIKKESAVYYIQGTSPAIYYGYLDKAIGATNGSGVVVVCETGTVYSSESKSIDIPSGVSVLVPYVATDTTIDAETKTVEGGWNSTYEHANVKFVSGLTHGNTAISNVLLPNKEVTYTLTIPSGTTVTIASGGKFVIGGTIASGHENTAGIVGGTAGAHSNVQLEGTLNVNGILSSCGYILGDGTVNVNSEGTVYQPFIFLDHRDGHYVSVSNDDRSFPFNRHAMLNVQSKIHLTSGGQIKGYADIYTQTTSAGPITVKERHNVVCLPLIGQSGALINLTAGILDISYDSTRFADDTTHNSQGLYNRVGTTIMNFAGTATFASFSMTINVAASDHTLDTSKDYFPVPYNYVINLKNPDTGNGTYTIQSMMKIMPGAMITVDENATLNVTGSLAIMEGLRDHGVRASSTNVSTWSAYHYPSTEVIKALNGNGMANLIVNGTLNVTGGLGGIVQTTSSTGKIIMGEKASTSLTVKVGSPSANKIMYVLDTAVCGRTVYELPARLYKPDGTVFDVAANSTYVAQSGTTTNTLEKYTYTYYNSSSNTSSTAANTITINAAITGSWACEKHKYAATITSPTCTAEGYTTYICHCNDSYVDTYVAALGHTKVTDAAVAPTCTKTGLEEGSHCSVCSEVLTAQKVIEALGHTPGAAATCTKAQLCTVCDTVLTKAIPHDWQEQVKNGNVYTCSCSYDCGVVVKLNVAYRLDDYLWFNGYTEDDFLLGEGVTVTGDTQSIVSNGRRYFVKAISANEISNDLTITIAITGGQATFTVNLKDYVTGDDEALKQALLNYGAAAKDYFDKTYGNSASDDFVKPGQSTVKPSGDQVGKPVTDGSASVSIATKGATIYFDETLRLSVKYDLTGLDDSGKVTLNGKEYTVVQIGLLTQKFTNSWDMTDLVLTTGSSDFTAYLVYNNTSLTPSSGGALNYPYVDYGEEGATDISKYSASGEITFDLKAQDYNSGFALRTFAVLQTGEGDSAEYVCVYGGQYGYGLEAYINALYDASADDAEAQSFNYLLEMTWALAQVAK